MNNENKLQSVFKTQFSLDKFDYSRWFGKYHNSGQCIQLLPMADDTYILLYKDFPRTHMFHIKQSGQVLTKLHIGQPIIKIHILDDSKYVMIIKYKKQKPKDKDKDKQQQKLIQILLWNVYNNSTSTHQIKYKQQKIYILYFNITNIVCIIQQSQTITLSYYKIIINKSNQQNQLNQQCQQNKITNIVQFINTYTYKDQNNNRRYGYGYGYEKYQIKQIDNRYKICILRHENSSSQPQTQIIIYGLDHLQGKVIQFNKYTTKIQHIVELWEISKQIIYIKGQKNIKYKIFEHCLLNVNTELWQPINLDIKQDYPYHIQFLNNFRHIPNYQVQLQKNFNVNALDYLVNIPVYIVHVYDNQHIQLVGSIIVNRSINIKDSKNAIIQYKTILADNGNISNIKCTKFEQIAGVLDRKMVAAFLLHKYDTDLGQQVLALIQQKNP